MVNQVSKNTQTQTQTQTQTAAQEETFTKEEVLKMIQSESDKRVAEALKKAQSKKEKEDEAKKLESLSDNERMSKKIELLEEQLAQRDKENALNNNKIVLQSEMSKRNIPVELAEFLISEDADKMHENLKTFEKAFKNAVNSAVEKRIPSQTPGRTTAKTTGEVTKDVFKKMSIVERNALFNSNRELYNELSK